MLRSSIVAGLLALAGVIGWLALSSDCDGKVVRNSWQCVRNAGFEPAFCNGLFEQQEDAIRRAPASYPTEIACRGQFAHCQQEKKSGWTPKPTPYCVVRGPDGKVARIEPAA